MNRQYQIIGGLCLICLLFSVVFFLFFHDRDLPEDFALLADDSDEEMLVVTSVFILSDSLKESIVQDVDFFLDLFQDPDIQGRFREINLKADDTRLSSDFHSPDFSQSVLDENISRQLVIFQEDHPQKGFMEIFVTDVRGMRIGQTNPSNDYFHGDESWWLRSKDSMQFESIEQDPFSGVSSLTTTFPLVDSEGLFMGVGHILIDIVSIRQK